jgi:hypothetical protein
MKLESLVIPDQHCRGEYVPGPCTHRRSRWPNRKEGAVEGGVGDWGEVVTR